MAFGGYKIKGDWVRFKPESKDPFVISRSKIDRFTECPRCFWLEARYGIGRPSTAPFTLNNAVDELFKKEFDVYRDKGEAHPIMKKYGIDAVPYSHEKIEEWRDAFKRGIKYHHEPTNITLRGGIDDVWVNPKGELYIVDYKATAGKKEITLDDDWKIVYKRQVEVYQWLFRKNGFTVSPTAYFVYANGQNDRPALNEKLEFDITVLPYEGDDSWIESTLFKLKEIVASDSPPDFAIDCEYCSYRTHAGKTLLALHRERKIHKI